MHNLDQSIAEWRKNISRMPGLGPDTLDELENHLRETISELVESGTPEREAVQKAMEQLGLVGEVTAEFQKLSPATWLPLRIVTVIAGVFLLVRSACGVVLPQLRPLDSLLAAHVYLLLLGFGAGVLLGVLGICFVIQRSFAEFSTRRAEALARAVGRFAAWGCAFTTLGVILGMVYSQREWGRLWGWSPREVGGLCVVLWQAGFLAVQRFRRLSVSSLFVASLAGSSVVLLAVSGPPLFEWGTHMYGRALLSHWPVLLVLVVNALFFFVGLVPAGWLRLRKGVVS
ncbi:MAG: cytochrome c biogenesis protein [Prosthecobacter sp.]|uniref:cytochrome c biogenesis protein CcsA n=1 Tax=Prosthecobacter sp. TaxID=1965333 RepID=UPI002619EE53|nr:cytochrome c biogenesis protein CcsA [Prosthecobacter sp.]MCF7788795.1 cytochrome c biogenesis protein [Prosthecobacter sp.]